MRSRYVLYVGQFDPRKNMDGLFAAFAQAADRDADLRLVIVGTLGTIYGIEGTTQSMGLQAALRHDLTPGGAAALLVFFAFAMQCMSTVAVVRRETAGWRWPAIQFAYMTVFAYVFAFLANRIVSLWF